MSGENGRASLVPAMRLAYADPPYLGCCRFYDHYHPDGRCWDEPETHRLLIARLTDDYPDGWALSCTSPSLRTLLPFCPDNVRVGAWVKPFHVYKKGVRPAYAWEPLLFRGGRNSNPPTPPKGGAAITPKDFVSANITLRKGLTGAKPEPFNRWVLEATIPCLYRQAAAHLAWESARRDLPDLGLSGSPHSRCFGSHLIPRPKRGAGPSSRPTAVRRG